MKPSIILATIAFALGASTVASDAQTAASTAPAADAKLAEQRLAVDAQRSKKSRIEGGDADDRLDRITFTVKLSNNDTRASFEDCTSEFYVLAQSIINRSAYQVLGVTPSSFSLPPRGMHSFVTEELITRWDRTNARFGSQYHAWVLVIRDKAGGVLLKKASVPAWVALAEKLGTMGMGQYFDRTLKPIKGVR